MLRIYIKDLAAYNAGALIGRWVSLPMELEELNVEINEILHEGELAIVGKNHEEYFITDYEFANGYKLFDVNEYSNIEQLNEQCEELIVFADGDLKAIAFLMDNELVCNLENAIEKFEDVFIYQDCTIREVVEEYIEQTIDLDSLPQIIANNINYDSIVVDFEISGEYYSIDNDIYHYLG